MIQKQSRKSLKCGGNGAGTTGGQRRRQRDEHSAIFRGTKPARPPLLHTDQNHWAHYIRARRSATGREERWRSDGAEEEGEARRQLEASTPWFYLQPFTDPPSAPHPAHLSSQNQPETFQHLLSSPPAPPIFPALLQARDLQGVLQRQRKLRRHKAASKLPRVPPVFQGTFHKSIIIQINIKLMLFSPTL